MYNYWTTNWFIDGFFKISKQPLLASILNMCSISVFWFTFDKDAVLPQSSMGLLYILSLTIIPKLSNQNIKIS